MYPAPFAVLLNKDDKTYVEPDISVICDKSKLDDRGCSGAPERIIIDYSQAAPKQHGHNPPSKVDYTISPVHLARDVFLYPGDQNIVL